MDDHLTPAAEPAPPRRTAVLPTGPAHRVTTLELFFDLVFVFAFTQVTAQVAAAPDGLGAVRGLVVAALLWWVWCSYSWLGNQAQADAGVLRPAMFLAMTAVMVLALAIPTAWHDGGGGPGPALLLVVCMTIAQWCHLGVYLVAAGGDRTLVRQIALVAAPVLAGNVLLLVGALAPAAPRTWWWGLAMVVNYSGIYLAGASGWRLPAPGHFAERYSLIVLIAIGESIVSIGVGVGDVPPSGPIVLGTCAAIAVSIALWWLYFDVLALEVEHRLVGLPAGTAQTALARDTFTYLHFPVVVAILALAVGLKKVLSYLGDPTAHDLGEALHGLPALTLAGGPAVFLLALVAVRRRNTGRLDRPELLTAGLLVVLTVCGGALPALGYLLSVALLMLGLPLVTLRSRAARRYRLRAHHVAAAPVDGSAGAAADAVRE